MRATTLSLLALFLVCGCNSDPTPAELVKVVEDAMHERWVKVVGDEVMKHASFKADPASVRSFGPGMWKIDVECKAPTPENMPANLTKMERFFAEGIGAGKQPTVITVKREAGKLIVTTTPGDEMK